MNSELFLESYLNDLNKYHNEIKEKYKIVDYEEKKIEVKEIIDDNKPVKEIRK